MLTLGGRPIHRNTLYHMFTNIRYAGIIPVPGVADEFEKASYPAMITLAEFDEAQRILGNRGKPRQAVSKEFAYRGFLFCKQCGCQITAEDKVKRQKNGTVRRYIYYHCTLKRPCSNRKMVEEEDLAGQFNELLDSHALPSELEEWALASIDDIERNDAKDQESIKKAGVNALQQLQRQYDKLIDMASKELITDETFKQKSELLKKQIKDLERNVAALAVVRASWRSALLKTIDVMTHCKNLFETGDVLAKRNVLLSLGSDPRLYQGKFELTPFEWLEHIRDALPGLKTELDKVRTNKEQMSKKHLTDWLNGIKSNWLETLGEARTLFEESPEAATYGEFLDGAVSPDQRRSTATGR